MRTNRLINEVSFHNERYLNKKRSQAKFYVGLEELYLQYRKILNKNIKVSKNILEIGCGDGEHSPRKIFDANYFGIDCSIVAIKACKDKFKGKNYSFIVGDISRMPFPDNYFDFVFGMGILHHLDLNSSLSELKRVSKNGNILFAEPLGLNPFINFYRFLTPNSRSPDEKPLSRDDLRLIQRMFQNSDLSINLDFFGFFSILRCYFPSKFFFKFSYKFDKIIHVNSFIRLYFWSSLIYSAKKKLSRTK